MANHSTSKILAILGGTANNIHSPDAVDEQIESIPTLQLQPSADMEHILTNSLGANYSKKSTPMD